MKVLFIAIGTALLFKAVKLGISFGIAFWFVLKNKFAQTRKVYDLPWSKGQLKSELIACLKVNLFDAVLFAVLSFYGLFSMKMGTPVAFVGTLLLMIVWFDFWFYWSHRLLHTRRFYWIHKQHHIAKVSSPLSTISFSVLERAIYGVGGLVLPLCLAKFFPLSMGAISVYLIFNGFFNLYGHMNIELSPNRWKSSRFFLAWVTPTYHSMHHARYVGNYALLIPYFDKWFGTYFDDYPEVFDRVTQNEPMKVLNERLPKVVVPHERMRMLRKKTQKRRKLNTSRRA